MWELAVIVVAQPAARTTARPSAADRMSRCMWRCLAGRRCENDADRRQHQTAHAAITVALGWAKKFRLARRIPCAPSVRIDGALSCETGDENGTGRGANDAMGGRAKQNEFNSPV